MNQPTITAVVATYNRERLVTRAIRSIQAQTYPGFKIAIYDNASTDGTEGAVRALAQSDARIVYHRHEANVGASNNFLFGMHRIETELFHFLSDDDVVFPDLYADAVSWLERYPEARFAGGGTLEMSDEGELFFSPQAYWPTEGFFAPPQGIDLMLSGFQPAWTTTIFRRRVLEEVGTFDPEIRNVADLDYQLRIACRYPYVVFRKPSGIFVRHGGSSATAREDASLLSQLDKMANRLLEAADISAETKALIKSTLADQVPKRMLHVAIKQLVGRQPREARATLRAYRAKFLPNPLYVLTATASALGNACPPFLGALAPLDAMRRRVRTQLSYAKAKANRLAPADADHYAGYLK